MAVLFCLWISQVIAVHTIIYAHNKKGVSNETPLFFC